MYLCVQYHLILYLLLNFHILVLLILPSYTANAIALISFTIGGYDETDPVNTILIWKLVKSCISLAEYLYSLNVVSSSAGVTVVSSLPSLLNGVQFKSSMFLTSSGPDTLK